LIKKALVFTRASFDRKKQKTGYAGVIASAGHAATHAPQSVHFPASMTKMGSPSLIASTGHSGTQVPQARQASVIL
jgi:hypothetical protein